MEIRSRAVQIVAKMCPCTEGQPLEVGAKVYVYLAETVRDGRTPLVLVGQIQYVGEGKVYCLASQVLLPCANCRAVHENGFSVPLNADAVPDPLRDRLQRTDPQHQNWVASRHFPHVLVVVVKTHLSDAAPEGALH